MCRTLFLLQLAHAALICSFREHWVALGSSNLTPNASLLALPNNEAPPRQISTCLKCFLVLECPLKGHPLL